MKVNGEMMKDALMRHELRRNALTEEFRASLFQFPDEKKNKPDEIMRRLVATEEAIALLQAAQCVYNIRVTVEVQGKSMPLAQAVKLAGGAQRVETLWRDSLDTPDKRRRFYTEDTPTTRSKEKVYAERALSTADTTELAIKAVSWHSAVRAAIGQGNRNQLDMELDAKLFE